MAQGPLLSGLKADNKEEREWRQVYQKRKLIVTGNIWGKSCTGGITLTNLLDLSVLHSYLNQINNKTLTPNPKSGCLTCQDQIWETKQRSQRSRTGCCTKNEFCTILCIYFEIYIYKIYPLFFLNGYQFSFYKIEKSIRAGEPLPNFFSTKTANLLN